MRSLFFILIFLPIVAYSQTEITMSLDQTELFPDSLISKKNRVGKVLITQDERLKQILLNYNEAYEQHKLTGWRVQIYFGSGNKASVKARTVLNDFKTLHPDVNAYLEYEEPYFKVKVGDFLTRLEAAKFKFLLEQEGYNDVFLVEDEIKIK